MGILRDGDFEGWGFEDGDLRDGDYEGWGL